MKKSLFVSLASVLSVALILTLVVYAITKKTTNTATASATDSVAVDAKTVITAEPAEKVTSDNVSLAPVKSSTDTISASTSTSEVEALFKDKKFDAAKDLADKINASADVESQIRIEDEMIKNWDNLLKSDTDYVYYTTKQGDSFIEVARIYQKRYNKAITYGSIKFFNGFSSDILKPFVKIRIPTGDFSILARREQFRLTIFYNNVPIKSYKIGIGQENLTPSGEFVVSTKTAKPNWYTPKESEYKGIMIPYGDQRNILGTHWLGLDNIKYRGIGIHGTNDPLSIGTKSSRGCLRLVNDDVAQIHEIIPQGTKVTIQ